MPLALLGAKIKAFPACLQFRQTCMEGKKKLKLSQCKTVPKLEVQGFEHFYFLLSDCDHTGALLSEWQVETDNQVFLSDRNRKPKTKPRTHQQTEKSSVFHRDIGLTKKTKQNKKTLLFHKSLDSHCIWTS